MLERLPMRFSRSSLLGWLIPGALIGIPLASAALPLPGGAPETNNDGGPSLFEVYNRFTGSSLESNADLPTPLADETFTLGPTAGAFLISDSASFSNDFGYYTRDGGETRHALFTGVSGFEYLGAPFQFEPFGVEGAVGLFLNANGQQIWHSESGLDSASTAINHLVAYVMGDIDIPTAGGTMHVTNAILLGWEDLNPGDADYDDLVAVIGDASFTPVPEPGTAVYLGGALGMLALHRRMSKILHNRGS
jgi:hypothetical protein